MKILILEDNLYTAEHIGLLINTKLQNRADFVICNDIYEANEILEKCNDIMCIVSDLNMNPDGLGIEQYIETEATTITGWIWVKSYVLNNDKFDNIPIVFYSAFIEDLKKSADFDENLLMKRVELISKEEENCELLLCERIELIIEEKLA